MLNALEHPVPQDASHDAGKLRIFPHRLGEAGAQGPRELLSGNVRQVGCLTDLLNGRAEGGGLLRQSKCVVSGPQLTQVCRERRQVAKGPAVDLFHGAHQKLLQFLN